MDGWIDRSQIVGGFSACVCMYVDFDTFVSESDILRS